MKPIQPGSSRSSGPFGFFIQSPIFAVLAVMAMVIGGVVGYRSMIKESYPDLGIPVAIVSTEWVGATPEMVEKEITVPIEKRILGLQGLKNVESMSTDSVSLIVVQFTVRTPILEAVAELRAKVEEAKPDLPEKAKPPRIERIGMTDSPVLAVMISGNCDEVDLARFVRMLKKDLERVPGVKKVESDGHREEIVRIRLIQNRLRSLGLDAQDVRNRIKSANLSFPWGSFENDTFRAGFRFDGVIQTIDELRALTVTRLPDGRVVRLREIADVDRGLSRETSRSYLSRGGAPFQRGAALYVFKTPGQDTIGTIERVKEELASLKETDDWLPGLDYETVYDESALIWEQINDTVTSGWQSMLAVFVILFLLLSWREAVVAGLCLPLTLAGATGILWGLGYSMNILILVGMILALGLLTDDFILMMEGMHEGIFVRDMRFFDAARHTITSYAAPSFAGSVTTIIALLPLMLIGGVDGKFIRQIPVTTAICLILSYLVSILVAIPMSRLLLTKSGGRFTRTRVDGLAEMAGKSLGRWLKSYAICSPMRAGTWVAGFLALFLLGVAAFTLLPQTLYPKDDGKHIGITVELPVDCSLEESSRVAVKLGDALRQQPYFRNVIKVVGSISPFSTDDATDLRVTQAHHLIGFSGLLTPKGQRKKKSYEYLDDIRVLLEDALEEFPGAHLTVTADEGGSSSGPPIKIVISGDDLDALRRISRRVRTDLSTIAGATDVRDNLGQAVNVVRFLPKREAMDFYGVDYVDLQAQMGLAVGHEKIDRFRLPGTQDDLDIYLSSSWHSRNGEMGGPKAWEELASLSVASTKKGNVPLLSLVEPYVDERPNIVSHRNGVRTVIVRANVSGATPQEILDELTPRLEKMKTTWPARYSYSFAAEAEASEEVFGSSKNAFLLGLFLVFAALALLFQSFRQPFIILFTAPLSLTGSFLGFFLIVMPFSFPAAVGLISLIGIVVNDAIVMVEVMNGYLKSGVAKDEAAVRGATDRIRPIISTTLTTIIALAPLAVSSPFWLPLCCSIIFGEIFGTCVALVGIPCLYFLVTPDHYPERD